MTIDIGKIEAGGGDATTCFQEIWCVDFEFRAAPGELPWPVCMVAREIRSGRELRLWREELLSLKRPPFDIGPDALFTAYFASAELGCFLELGWPLPHNVLDLYVEHRVDTNGEKTPCGDALLGALAMRGLSHIDAGDKDAMRTLICTQQHWTSEEQKKILDYCASDVEGLAALFPKMSARIDLPRAVLRGRYMKAVAQMERTGVPIDSAIYRSMVDNWDALKVELIDSVNRNNSICLSLNGVGHHDTLVALGRKAVPYVTEEARILAHLGCTSAGPF